MLKSLAKYGFNTLNNTKIIYEREIRSTLAKLERACS